MSKYLITLTKQEIEQAVLAHVNRSITVWGRRELVDPSVTFSNRDGDVGYLECSIEVDYSKQGSEMETHPNPNNTKEK